MVPYLRPVSKSLIRTMSPYLQICFLSQGRVVYFGPRKRVLDFFELCGFKIPGRKGVADLDSGGHHQEGPGGEIRLQTGTEEFQCFGRFLKSQGIFCRFKGSWQEGRC